MSKFKLISFYTDTDKSMYYSQWAKLLINDCNNLGISYNIKKIPNQGSWIENTRYKPKFILDNFNGPTLWVDVDSRIKEYPKVFDTLECDIAAVRGRTLQNTTKTLVGTLFFNYTQNSIAFLNNWKTICETTQWGDHNPFLEALKSFKGNVLLLPDTYCSYYNDGIINVASANSASKKYWSETIYPKIKDLYENY